MDLKATEVIARLEALQAKLLKEKKVRGPGMAADLTGTQSSEKLRDQNE